MTEDRVGGTRTHARTRVRELRMLDGFELRRDGKVVEVPPGVRTLVALLGLTGPRTRSTAAGTLWPDTSEAHALGRLRSCLWRLHRLWPELVVSTTSTLALSPELHVDTDAYTRRLRRLCDPSAPVRTEDLPLASTRVAELLPGWDEPWIVTEREHLRLLHVRALEALSARLLADGRNGLAMEAAQAAVACQPLRETAHRAVVAVHVADGNGHLARAVERRFQESLHAELGI